MIEDSVMRFLMPLVEFVKEEKTASAMNGEKVISILVSHDYMDALHKVQDNLSNLVIRGIPVKAASHLTGFEFSAELDDNPPHDFADPAPPLTGIRYDKTTNKWVDQNGTPLKSWTPTLDSLEEYQKDHKHDDAACKEQLMDGTDDAHPAWWRGCDHGVEMVCSVFLKALNKEDDGKGTYHPQIETIRRRILDIFRAIERMTEYRHEECSYFANGVCHATSCVRHKSGGCAIKQLWDSIQPTQGKQ